MKEAIGAGRDVVLPGTLKLPEGESEGPADGCNNDGARVGGKN